MDETCHCTFKLPEGNDVTRDMSNCICDKEDLKHGVECVICGDYKSVIMSKWEREEKCKVHHRKNIMICGPTEYVCLECKEAGWYSTAGWGGGTQHMNDRTKESKPVKERLRKK